jgi:hypothetical protein
MAAHAEHLQEYKAALRPFVARLVAADVARDLWLALTVRGPCGGKEGYAVWLLPPLVEAIEEALQVAATEAPVENTPPPDVGADNMKAEAATS